jgi:EpsI family protein
LLAQVVGLLAVSGREKLPEIRALSEFPAEFDGWRTISEGVVEKEVQDLLRADDLLTRVYVAEGMPPANLFVAYFKTQRTGQAPHSPKNCLPGSGWVPVISDTVSISSPGHQEDIRINRYLVERGNARSLVFYWYQTGERVLASEYWAKIYLVLDSLRLNRSDTALVRVVVPVPDGEIEETTREAMVFIRSVLEELGRFPQFQSTGTT